MGKRPGHKPNWSRRRFSVAALAESPVSDGLLVGRLRPGSAKPPQQLGAGGVVRVVASQVVFKPVDGGHCRLRSRSSSMTPGGSGGRSSVTTVRSRPGTPFDSTSGPSVITGESHRFSMTVAVLGNPRPPAKTQAARQCGRLSLAPRIRRLRRACFQRRLGCFAPGFSHRRTQLSKHATPEPRHDFDCSFASENALFLVSVRSHSSRLGGTFRSLCPTDLSTMR
jgi:hypothetical protein